MKKDLLAEFHWRGLLYDQTEGVAEAVASQSLTGYVGFDPTASSLHVGSLLQIMGLAHLQRHGHTPIALVGGATGMIGDPSGKSKERNLLAREDLERNQAGIRAQLEKFLDFDRAGNAARLVNNADWLAPMSFIDFLRDVGKHFPVNYMLAKDTVKRRLDQDGISFTEFSYMLLQAYDFYHLSRSQGCNLQMGGSDQWGNITAGIELIRKLGESKAHGIVLPLVTNSSGEKFGKTVDGAVWLDPEMTSPYRFYQFWLNTDDSDAIRYLKFFTLLEETDVAELAQSLADAPERREAQKRLAAEVTRTVHGETELARVISASKAMFGGNLADMDARSVQELFENVPSTELALNRVQGEGLSLIELFADCGVTKSRGEARRLLMGGGLYLNNDRVSDPKFMVTTAHILAGRFLVMRKGAKTYHLVKLVEG